MTNTSRVHTNQLSTASVFLHSVSWICSSTLAGWQHSFVSLLLAGGNTVAPSGLYARLCQAFLVSFLLCVKLSQYLLDGFSRSFHQMEVICVNFLSGPVFPIPQGTLPWQAILSHKLNTDHVRFLQFLYRMKAFWV